MTIALFFDPNPRQLHSAASALRGPSEIRNVVEVALGIGIDLIDRRRQEAAIDRQRRRHDARCAARALRMADHRLHRRSRHALGVIAEHLADGSRFDGVVQERRRAVIADVADLLACAGRCARSPASSRERSPCRPAPSARGGRRRRSTRSRRSTRRSWRRAPARDPHARARASTRLRRARTRRVPCRRDATPAPADRCTRSTSRACARIRRSSRA